MKQRPGQGRDWEQALAPRHGGKVITWTRPRAAVSLTFPGVVSKATHRGSSSWPPLHFSGPCPYLLGHSCSSTVTGEGAGTQVLRGESLHRCPSSSLRKRKGRRGPNQHRSLAVLQHPGIHSPADPHRAGSACRTFAEVAFQSRALDQ